MNHGPVPAMFSCVPRIERHLDEIVRAARLPAELVDAIRYALLGGGKRLRPVLAWHACEAVGGSGEASLPAGAAVELIHAFSLVHDDLPAIDDDDLRRGRPTLHLHAGEAMAILAGDAMMSLAFQVLADGAPYPALAAALVRDLADATTKMIAGQVCDTVGTGGRTPDRARLEMIHLNKTAALIRAACVMGARCGLRDAPESDARPALEAVERFGEAVGLMFQIVDDLLDVEMTPEQTGKRTRKDAVAGKLTYPSLLGKRASREEIERLRFRACESIGVLGTSASALRELCDALAVRRH